MGIGAALLVAGLAFVVVKKMGDNRHKKQQQQQMLQYGAPAGYGGGGAYRPPPPSGGMGGMMGGMMGGFGGGGGSGGGGFSSGSRDINASTGQPWNATPGPDYNTVLQSLIATINERRIGGFFPQGVESIAQRVVQTGAVQRVATEWRIPQDLAIDLVKLALFDIVVLCDDSASMRNGDRISDLQQVLAKVAFAGTLLDDDGIEIRFVNNYMQGNRINSQDAAVDIVDNINFDGAKPLGTAIEQKILQPMVLAPARQNALRKPLLVIVITDGQPTGEPFGYLQQSIVNAANQLNSTPYGPKAVSYQFAQVGTDMSATQFLAALDNDPMVGAMIDCTSDYDIESQEMLQKTGQQLTPIMWLMKLMLGGIDSSYDSQDG